MEEEVLIFPSDIDAKIRELEDKFSQSLRLLGGYVKSKIQGRGMNAVTQVMDAAATMLSINMKSHDQFVSEQV
jgi:hypothetical protein